jgi:hypothetical protein
MDVFHIKKGDRLPKLRMLLTDSTGTIIDLTNATVKFRMRLAGASTLKVNSTATNVGSGIVEYPWAAIDTDTPGTYSAEWELTYSGGVQTVPTAGFVTVVVEQNLP